MGTLTAKRLVALRTHRRLGRIAHLLLRYLHGIDLPREVSIGPDVALHHRAFGLVVHPNTVIGARVHLFHGVTIGQGGAIWEADPRAHASRIVIEDDVWLTTGATVLADGEELRVGRGTIVGANSVLRESTGAWEIWAGVPARRIGVRSPSIWIGPGPVGRTIPVQDSA